MNTLPPKTLDAARDHARLEPSIVPVVEAARAALAGLEQSGISMDDVTRELEVEGVQAFAESIGDVLGSINERAQKAVAALGPLADQVAGRISQLSSDSYLEHFWGKDATLWATDPSAQADIARRMGWLDSPQKARAALPAYCEFAEQVRAAGITRFLVVGMGGSSLAPEVFGSVFGEAKSGARGGVRLGILDSTDPAQVAQAASQFPPDQSLYIVSSKSGGTAEVTAVFDYLWALARGDGSRFAAITDEGTSLQHLATSNAFRRVFVADGTVGGRFSALTDFGLVPAALLGVDLQGLLRRAEWMQAQCKRQLPGARSPGVTLGAALAEAALADRDKLTILADPPISALPNWIEQLVAESSGKEGKGILPVPLEPLDAPSVYGPDRMFVYLRQTGQLDGGVEALLGAGHPALVIDVPDPLALGAEFYRWEVAVATACHILGVNAFDQPDVQESKDRTNSKIQEYRKTRQLQEGAWDADVNTSGAEIAVNSLRRFLQQAGSGDYIAINAYLPRREDIEEELQRLRVIIREQTRLAVTGGFGPRFQHSTGQLHKGGPNSGLFVQIVSDTPTDLEIPDAGMSFGTLIRSQALGDYETLVARKRRVWRLHLSRPEDIALLRRALN